MRLRWLVYGLVGLLFGILDWYFLAGLAAFGQNEAITRLLEQSAAIWQQLVVAGIVALNYGIWLVPVIPVAIYEMNHSHARVKAILAAILLWVMAICSYYAYYAILLVFIGLPNMDFMLYANRHASTYWADFWPAFQRIIIDQLIEWLWVAVIGGAIVASASVFLARRFKARPLAGKAV